MPARWSGWSTSAVRRIWPPGPWRASSRTCTLQARRPGSAESKFRAVAFAPHLVKWLRCFCEDTPKTWGCSQGKRKGKQLFQSLHNVLDNSYPLFCLKVSKWRLASDLQGCFGHTAAGSFGQRFAALPRREALWTLSHNVQATPACGSANFSFLLQVCTAKIHSVTRQDPVERDSNGFLILRSMRKLAFDLSIGSFAFHRKGAPLR